MRKSSGMMKLGSGDRLKRLAHECVAVADWVDNVEISGELIRISFRILRMANTGVVSAPRGVREPPQDQSGMDAKD
jgi:hypothetical protein